MKNFILIVGSLFIGLTTFAQGPSNIGDKKGTISGKVLESRSNVPMEYTSIALYSMKDSSLVTGTVTNTAGIFVLDDVSFGKYYLEIHFVGYDKLVQLEGGIDAWKEAGLPILT